MYTFLKPLYVRNTLLAKGIRIFTRQDFERIFKLSHFKAKYFLEKQTKEKLLVRLKQGLYLLETDQPSEEEIANALYKPSYISFEYALAYYNLIPEMPYTVTSATTKPTRQFSFNEVNFAYYTIKQEAYMGYSLVKKSRLISGVSKNVFFNEIVTGGGDIKAFLIAEPEKALVDYLYFVAIGKRMKNERLAFKNNMLNKKKLVEYAKLYNRSKLMELVREFL